MRHQRASEIGDYASFIATHKILLSASALNALLVFMAPDFIKLFGEYSVGVFSDYYHYIAKNILDGHGYRFFPETAETLLRSPSANIKDIGLSLML